MADSFVPLNTWISVDSSNVEKVFYDPEKETLAVQFKAKGKQRARRYLYSGVPMRVFVDFVQAPSKGKFVWKHIRDRYVYTEV